MENHSYSASITESGDSSPENEFENPPPWEDQPPSNNPKLKFMCSYGGKIHPRPHDNQLSYIGGETKILAVDRNIKFSGMIAKLSALCNSTEVCFKYQLPGEDLDALISVTNDDDLEHLIHEYDRLCMKSAKPARLRLFLFPASFGSNKVKSDPESVVDAPNSVPIQVSNDVDFLFGSDQISESTALEKEIRVAGSEDRVTGSDSIHSQISDLQRLQIGGHEQAMHRRRSDDNLVGGFAGDYYYQNIEKVPPATSPVTVQSPTTLPAGYWQENQMVTGAFPATSLGAAQQVYMIQSPVSMYHAPYGRPVTVSAGQGYYAVQSMPSEVYRNQPVYSVMQPMATTPPQQLGGPPISGGAGVTDTGYGQMAYDSGMGRQVFYTATGGGVTVMAPPYQAVNDGEGKVVTKVSQ